MRGGQYVNNWRMAELRCKGSYRRAFTNWKPGARCLTAPQEGKNFKQRNFGGHRYPRLAHVGDRTGLEMIRTLQDHGIHQGITVHMEYARLPWICSRTPAMSWARSVMTVNGDASGFSRPRQVVVCTGGLGRAYKVTSNSWEGTGDGVSRSRTTRARNCWTWNSSSFIRPGMIWPPSVMGILVTERRAR